MSKNRNNLLEPAVRENLEKYGVVHGVLECEPEFADTTEFCEQYGFKSAQCANTIIVVNKNSHPDFAACVILATTKLDVNKKVCELMEVKHASFARADQVLELTGMKIGGVTVFGLPSSLPIFIDAEVLNQLDIIMGGGNRISKIRLDPRELQKLPNVSIHQELAHTK